MRAFLDTNILVYAQHDDRRSARARQALAAGGVISVQVLNEFANVLRRKLSRSWDEIAEAVDDVAALLDPPRPLTAETHMAALVIARQYQLSFYDALIVAAAVEANCALLLTEDLQHGQTIEGLTIQNPFLARDEPA